MSFKRRIITQLFLLIVLAAVALFVALPGMPDLKLGSWTSDFNINLGLDLQGGAQLVYEADLDQLADQNETELEDALQGVRDVIARRIDPNGVGESIVQIQGENRLLVELPGISDVQAAMDLIGQTPLLEFRTEGEAIPAELDVPLEMNFVATKLNGSHLVRADVSQQQGALTPSVSLKFNSEGKDLFAEITKNNIGKQVAIYLDGSIISAPVVQQSITNGEAVISGNFTLEEARELKQRLNAGALPVPIKAISQHTVGATLGAQSVQASLFAGLLGLIAVALFMIVLYRLPGLLSVIALALYASITIALFKILGITLTLAGAAGFILSIGLAVDANVLIFERIREELKLGRSIKTAIEEGFKRAWAPIRDANISTLITTLILFIFTTSVMKGFAITLALGVIVSMFSAIIITRNLLRVFVGRWSERHSWLLGWQIKKVTDNK
ncbi:protein translocase subunit SecD [Patescibacteria group bacterium]